MTENRPESSVISAPSSLRPLYEGSLAHTQACASMHFSPWMIEENWFRQAVEAVRNGTLPPREDEDENEDEDALKYVNYGGVAYLPIAGAMMKKRGKYAQTSSVEVRRAIRLAVEADDVHSILLHIDSPGGTVAGTADLADDVRRANAEKPVYAHIDDLGASAAYWIASQARRITANPTGLVGSIGTLLVLDDTSGMYAAKGIKVHVISTGQYKGAGVDGAPVSSEHLNAFQQEVDDLNEHFLHGVIVGRKGRMTPSQVRAVADGRVHIAAKAKELGLIDEVASLDAAMTYAAHEHEQPSATNESSQGTNSSEGDAEDTNAPEDSLRSEPQPAESTKETPTMADTPNQVAPAQPPVAGVTSNSGQGETVKALNEQAIQGFIDQGRQLGRAEGRKEQLDRMRSLAAACPGKPQIAINAFLAGQNEDVVRMLNDVETRAESEARQKTSAMEVEIARLQAQIATGGHPGVSIAIAPPSGSPTAMPDDMDPEAQARLEWDSDPILRAKNANKETWMRFRVQQLKGNVRTLVRH